MNACTGNDQFITGDKIERPKGGGQGSGSGEGNASPDGESQDEFVFQISKDEYLDILFEDLELPNLEKIKSLKLRNGKLTEQVSKPRGSLPTFPLFVHCSSH